MKVVLERNANVGKIFFPTFEVIQIAHIVKVTLPQKQLILLFSITGK